MSRINKNLLRTALVLSYILVIALIVFGVTSLYNYLNTGADRSSMLHTEIKKDPQYLPKVKWAPLKNEGRTMDTQTLNRLESDYLNAWYVKQVAYKTNGMLGIDDYYTEHARKQILNTIALNKKQNIQIEGTTLNHNPVLEFFSADGQLAVITDNHVIEYKRIFQNKTCILETNEKATYKIILLLEDGFWRIRHKTKIEVTDYKPKFTAASSKNKLENGINYYPQDTPWDMFGKHFSRSILSKDFKIIKKAGLSSIRLFVPYEDFGKANVNPEKLNKLKQTLDIAEVHGLKVMVTLFDFYGDYSVLNWTLNHRHAEAIVSHLKSHPALLAWDIKNEPNLDFKSRKKGLVIAWLDKMIDLVKSIDQIHPVTIGWSNIESGIILKDKLDLISFHYYEKLENLENAYKILRQSIPNKPITITEFGLSSYRGLWNPFGNSEQEQAAYHKKAQQILRKNNISGMPWTLYDFTEIPKEVVGRLPWRKYPQEYFGFIDKEGKTKPAFQFISKD